MSTLIDAKAYGLGKRAYKANSTECLPMEDKLFMQYLDENDLPIVQTITAYVDGWHEGFNKKEAKEKVIQFPGNSNENA